ncbi:hypothetical protein Hanom_Chr14g01256961 [Helianthus anomalus]
MMFMVFLARTEPAQSMAKPSCMANTRYAEKRRYVLSMAYLMLVKLSEVFVKRVHMYSAAAVALPVEPRRVVRSAVEQAERDVMAKGVCW